MKLKEILFLLERKTSLQVYCELIVLQSFNVPGKMWNTPISLESVDGWQLVKVTSVK